jgi:SAM-dependent methyltransferase
VIEPASNDGYMLKNFHEFGIPVIGIDPADGPAKTAVQNGIPTINQFFGVDLAYQLKKEGKQADLIIANNVLAHVADLNGFVEGLSTLLKLDGTAVLEMPYLLDLIDHCEFDTIYHQHLCYFSVTALKTLFERHTLYINDVRRINIHGGSLRVYISHRPIQSERVQSLLQQEKDLQIQTASYYKKFTEQVSSIKTELLEILTRLKQDNKRIVGYGAAAKACTLLSYLEIDKKYLDYIVDLSPIKHNRFMGGNHLEIFPVEKLMEDDPNYTLILAWNFSDEIMQQQSAYAINGGKFIVPIPYPEIKENQPLVIK